MQLQKRAWKTTQSPQVLLPRWSSTALWRTAPLRVKMAWAQGQQLRPWQCLCWQEWASSSGLRVDPLTLSWLHSLNLLPDDERCHHGPEFGSTLVTKGYKRAADFPNFPNLEVQISHLPSSLCSSALSDPPVESSCCGLELSSSLLGMDWDYWESFLFTLP